MFLFYCFDQYEAVSGYKAAVAEKRVQFAGNQKSPTAGNLSHRPIILVTATNVERVGCLYQSSLVSMVGFQADHPFVDRFFERFR